MGSGMPEIGSRISLISKADIRYEGKLYSVDPEECTIALSSVRSYGTEDRKTTYPVPAQNQVYDYILFRGSDIKDIRVLTTTIPNDPAIVQLSVPPSINELQFQSQPGFGPSIASMTMPNVVPGPSRGQSASGEFQNAAGFSTPAAGTNITIPKPQPVPNISEDESRSSTPSTQNAVQHKNANDSNRPQNAYKSDEQTHQRRPAYQQRDNRPNQQNRYQQQQKPQYQQQRYPQHQQQQNQRYPQQQRYMQPQYRDYRDTNNQYRNQNDYRDQYVNRQYPKWNNQRPGPQSNQQQNYQSAAYQNRKPRNTLKFDSEFDFEQANSQFEEVKSKLASVKIDDSVKVNGDVEAKKEDSGNEVSGEENEPDNEDKPIFYDKVKSFFDQISYEAIERSKGHTQRLDWKTERKINSETFGPVALRRNNNFRGPRPGGNYYNNYQSNNYQGNNYQNRNPAMANKFRGGYRQKTPQTRRPYNEVKVNDDSKGNQSA